jgi:hypothetical protein
MTERNTKRSKKFTIIVMAALWVIVTLALVVALLVTLLVP